MEDELKKAVEDCAKKASKAISAIDALQYTQAALNAANALVTITLNVK